MWPQFRTMKTNVFRMSQLALEIFGLDLYFDIDLAFVLLQRPLVQILGSLCFYPDLNSIENMWGYIGCPKIRGTA
jgi:hypothetical protein